MTVSLLRSFNRQKWFSNFHQKIESLRHLGIKIEYIDKKGKIVEIYQKYQLLIYEPNFKILGSQI
jgi:hypothetical protein